MNKKVAVVTGTSYGMGEAIAEKLLCNHWKVYGISRSKPKISSEDFIWIQADLAQESSFIDICKAISEDNIDLLVNNAGIFLAADGLNFENNTFDKIFDINFKAPIRLTQTLISKLNEGSVVINVSSVSDRIAGEECGMYCASKAALNMYFDCTALENPHVKFISILPSYVNTPLLKESLSGESELLFESWDEIIQPDQIANLVDKIISEPNKFEDSARIIVITNALKEDAEHKEKLLIYNAEKDTIEER